MQSATPAVDEMYCSSCGRIIKRRAEICVHCGVRVREASSSIDLGQYSGC
ncbi:MAG: hypothetical protein WD208_12760 [Dehalococcoidia bacterium]